jgi:hypothetical protein
MEILPFIDVFETNTNLPCIFLSDPEFVQLNHTYQYRASSLSNMIKDANTWHNIFINHVSSVIPPEHQWNKDETALFTQVCEYHRAARGVFLEHVKVRDWFFHGIDRIIPLIYPEEIHLRNQKQQLFWDLFLHGGHVDHKYEQLFHRLKTLRQQMEDHTELCRKMLATVSSYYSGIGLWLNPIDLNCSPTATEE